MIKLPNFLKRINEQVLLIVSVIFILAGLALDSRLEDSSLGIISLSVGALFLILLMLKRISD
jgi:hypothetical protein